MQVSNVKATDFPLSGSDTTTTYFANGVLKTKNTFTLGTPSPDHRAHYPQERARLIVPC